MRHSFTQILVTILILNLLSLPIAARAADMPEMTRQGVSPAENTMTPSEFSQSLGVIYESELPSWMRTNFESDEAQTKLTNDANKKLSKPGLNTVAGVGKTMVLMLVLAGVRIAQKKAHEAKLEGKDLSSHQLESIAKEAAKQVLDNGEIWLSILTSTALKPLAQKPAKLLMQILGNEEGKNILENMLGSGISSFITFVGWDAAAELWDESTRMIHNKKEYKMTGDIAGLIGGSLRNAEDRKVLSEICDNMIKILITDDTLRADWIYNTWRLQLGTGNFVVAIASMVTCSAVGTAIFPGVGTLGGLIFGVAGGLLAMAVPQSVDDEITEGVRFARRENDLYQMSSVENTMLSLIGGFGSFFSILSDSYRSSELTNGLKQLQVLRDEVATTYMETDYKSRVAAQSMQFEIETAKQTLAEVRKGDKNASIWTLLADDFKEGDLEDTIAKDQISLRSNLEDVRQSELGMRDFYSRCEDSMASIQEAAIAAPASAKPIELAADQDLARLRSISRWMNAWVRPGVDLTNPTINAWINTCYLNGYDENVVAKAAGHGRAPNLSTQHKLN